MLRAASASSKAGLAASNLISAAPLSACAEKTWTFDVRDYHFFFFFWRGYEKAG